MSLNGVVDDTVDVVFHNFTKCCLFFESAVAEFFDFWLWALWTVPFQEQQTTF